MKKRKPSSPVAVAMTTNSSTSSSLVTTTFSEQHRQTIKTLQRTISELARDATLPSSSSSLALQISSSLLALSHLKSLQRQLSLQAASHAATSTLRRTEVEERSLALANLNYERDYLREEIGAMHRWPATELEKMARSELGGAAGKGGGAGGTADAATAGVAGNGDMTVAPKIATGEDAIDAYLLGDPSATSAADHGSSAPSRPSDGIATRSHRDPTAHPRILCKLTADLAARASLVAQLSRSKSELKALQKTRHDLRGFLAQLPKKVRELERAGENLNACFDRTSCGNTQRKDVLATSGGDDDAGKAAAAPKAKNNPQEQVQAANILVHRPSSQRRRRFQLAQSNLPSPLYVLFVQLVGYVDAWSSLEKSGGVNAPSSGSNTSSTASDDQGRGTKRKSALDGIVCSSGMGVVAVPPREGEGLDGDRGSSANQWSVVLSLSPLDESSSILGKAPAHSSRALSLALSSAPAIEIVFVYSEGQGIVLASLRDDYQSKGFEDGLLDNLFPGDDGLVNPNVSLSLLREDDDGKEEDGINEDELEEGGDNHIMQDNTVEENTSNGNKGKPYYWCQVLSGLNFPPPNATIDSSGLANEPPTSNGTNDSIGRQQVEEGLAFQIQTCTKAVVRQLHRRIRARRTLTAIVNYLGKQRSAIQTSLPLHPAMRGMEECAAASSPPLPARATVQSWSEDTYVTTGAASTKRYTATIRHKSDTLWATVTVDARKYPVESPPTWSLHNEEGSSAEGLSSLREDHGRVSSPLQNMHARSPPLFNADLDRIATHVNNSLSIFANPDVESTYDWILMHQLAEIVACYEELMSAREATSNSSGKKSTGDRSGCGEDFFVGRMGGGQSRKEKERRLIGFGELRHKGNSDDDQEGL